jgi:hypothetical protein
MKHSWCCSAILLAAAVVAPAQDCASSGNIVSFNLLGVDYEIVKENLGWVDAAACAVERGGHLAEVDSAEEQEGLFEQLNLAGILPEQTVAPDGGGASYVWLGGNDLAVEGRWIWDGDNDGDGVQFWEGTASGEPVGGHYTNWGLEPDNWSNQDALGLAITDWPLGVAGQWNDVDAGNLLYYIIEFPPVGVGERGPELEPARTLVMSPNTPNPFNPETVVRWWQLSGGEASLTVHDLAGRLVVEHGLGYRQAGRHHLRLDGSQWPGGMYLCAIRVGAGCDTRKMLLLK